MFMLAKLLTGARRLLKAAPVAAALALGGIAAMVSAPAQAQWHHHGWGPRVGVYIGPGYYYPPPYYYAPPVYVAPSPPPVYIEQAPAQAAPAPAQPAMWYYCAASRSYYPYVKECPGGWQQVAPQPTQ